MQKHTKPAKNNTFSQGQKSVHVNRWRQRLSCELAEVVGKSVPKGARAMLRRDDSARVEMDGSSEFERAELFQETLDVAMCFGGCLGVLGGVE